LAAKTVVMNHLSQASRLEHLHAILRLIVPTALDRAIAAAALIGLVFVVTKRKAALRPALAYYAVYWAAYAASKLPAVSRYATPTLPVHLGLAAIGVTCVCDRVLARWPRLAAYGPPCVLLFAAFPPLDRMVRSAAEAASYERDVRTAAGLWIKDHSAPTDVVLVTHRSSVGPVGYYSERTMIDAKGTVTPAVLRFWGIEHVSPDYDMARAL